MLIPKTGIQLTAALASFHKLKNANAVALKTDELWSFVRLRKNKRCIGIVLCRRTRQVIAFVIGDRSAKTCQKLWKRIPPTYRSCHSFSDFWGACEKVFPEETHRIVGKDSGETNHVERWNCTLR